MPFSSTLDAILYYIFHFVYLGYPSDILARLWLAYDNAHPNTDKDRTRQTWKMFEDSMREYYRAIGTLAGLLAAAISGLSSIDSYRESEAIRTLLLAGLTSSVICASTCLSLLSTTYIDPVNIEHHWRSSGIMYIITLSGPPAWLALTLLLFQLSILAIVWLKESTPAKAIVTIFIVLRVVFRVASRVHGIWPIDLPPAELMLGLLGFTQGMTHTMVNLKQDAINKRMEYRRRLAEAISKDDEAGGLGGVLAETERRFFFRDAEQPTRDDFNADN